MSLPNVVVVSIDGFGVAAAGAYGQTSLPTPGWDGLAADAITFDFVEAPGASLASVFAAFAEGSSDGLESVAASIRQFAERGVACRLAGDLDDLLAKEERNPFVGAFEGRLAFDLAPSVGPAADEDATHALQWLAQAERELKALPTKRSEEPALLWLHHRGGSGTWDAPLDWREALRDDEDPAAYDGVESPALDLRSESRDPDRFLPFVFAWAGQAAAWDRLAEGLHLLWKRLDAKRPTTLIVFGLRGFPLGEHGVVGEGDLQANCPLLQEERLHVPFFVLPPGGAFPGSRSFAVRRSDRLIADLLARSLAESALDEAATEAAVERAFAAVQDGGAVSVRTTAWRYVRDEAGARLYFKPDDKWEANDVAARRRETVEAFERWLEERQSGTDPPLPEEATRL